MEWNKFNCHSEAPTKAFEAMCNQLFELWCKREYKEDIEGFNVVNGSGGDGGVEAYTTLKSGDIIGVQAKWFREAIDNSRITQIRKSIITAMEIRPNIKKYIVCVPRDLTSKRKTKGGNTSKGEEGLWNKLVEEMRSKYPFLKLELWNETKILTELQKPEAAGINIYWFENTQLSIERIKYSFANQEKGWLYNRYISDIHGTGTINEEVSKFIGSHQHRKDLMEKLSNGERVVTSLKKNLEDLFGVIDSNIVDINSFEGLSNIICELRDLDKKLCNTIYILQKSIKSVEKEDEDFSYLKNIDIECKYDVLRDFFSENFDIYKYKGIRYHLNDVKDSFNKFCSVDFYEIYKEVNKYLESDKMIILGNAGTGKTHGAADSIKKILDESYHIGILIQAKDISTESSWEEIILKTLNLGNKWDEADIWSALEAFSYTKEIEFVNKNKDVRVVPKVLICVDGIDESYPYNKWLERIRLIENITKTHKRIKFCITSRPYVFKEDTKKYNIVKISDEGDCDVDSIFNEYINHYKLDIKGKEWLRYGIKTPLALRLFCECYSNKRYIDTDNVSLSITRLLKQRIEMLNSEFLRKINATCCDEKYIHSAIFITAKLFLHEKRISKCEMIDILCKEDDGNKFKSLSKEEKDILISVLINNGILISYQVEDEDDLFSVPTTYYEFGIHTFSDYMLAKSIDIKNNIEIRDTFKNRIGVLQILSILLLEDKDVLISDCNEVYSKLDEELIKELSYFSLANANPSATKNHVNFIQKLMIKDRYSFNECVNKIIIPVSRIKNHPLNVTLLDKFLRNFQTPIERDLYWSLPDKLMRDYNYYGLENNYDGLRGKRFKLNSSDKACGLPLIYGWSLTNVDNYKKEYCRGELVKWGIECPLEYIKLLNNLYGQNDPQLKEELVALSMSIVLSGNLKGVEITAFASWVTNNIFDIGIIENTYDAAIREYGRSIIEYAFKYNKVTKEELLLSRPPYKKNKHLLKINKGALNGTRMGGYKSITYDLSRYVLCDPIVNDFFSEHSDFNIKNDNKEYSGQEFTIDEVKKYLKDDSLNKESRDYLENELEKLTELQKENNALLSYFNFEKFEECEEREEYNEENRLKDKFNENINDFLKLYAQSLELKEITAEQFIISTAYQYLIDMGLKPDSNDIILRNFHPATHGSKSTVMTFTEKYIWCFKNILIGYLSDRITFIHNDKLEYLDRYCSLIDYINPVEELFYVDMKSKMVKNNLFIPEGEFKNYTNENDITKWTNDELIINFSKWINRSFHEGKEFISLWRFSSIYGFNGYGEVNIWINSISIKKCELKLFLNDINKKKEHLIDILTEREELEAYNESEYYITPKEICCTDIIRESDSSIKNITIFNGIKTRYTIFKNYSECTCMFTGGEESYKMPSKIIRNLIGVTNFRNNNFINNKSEILGTYYKAGDVFKSCTMLLEVDKEKLLSELDNKDMCLVWIFHVMKQPTMKGRERYGVYPRHDMYWIVWYEEDELKCKLIKKICD